MSATKPLREYTLLTGATGLVGSHLLANLLRAQIPVVVLVRGSATQTAERRIGAILRRFEAHSGRLLSRPVVFNADLRQPNLSLCPENESWIASHCSRILHSAAHLSFRPAADRTDNEPYRTNVEGTRSLVELCRRAGISEFHHISTAYVCGDRRGSIRESDGNVGQSLSNDYERSKLQVEELLQNESNFDSLTIYRPSIVIDVSGPPAPDRTIQQAYLTYRLLRQQLGSGAAQDWYSSLGLTGQERKNIVHADWVARTAVQILRRPALHGRTYHLTSESGTSIAELATAFEQAFDEKSRPSRLKAVSKSPSRSVQVLDSSLKEFRDAFSPYFRDDPRFGRENLDHALSVCRESACPVIGIPDLKRTAIQSYPSKPTPGQVEQPSSESSSRLHGRQSLAPSSASEPSARFGLTLIGDGGGEWTIECASVVAGDLCRQIHIGQGLSRPLPACVYMTAATFELIYRQEITTAAAIETGRILIEEDVPGAITNAPLNLERLLAALRQPSVGVNVLDEAEVGRAK